MTTPSTSTSATRGWGGCLFALLTGGVGVVLLLLGLAPHTTEALPFGAGLFGLALIVGLLSALRLRRGLSSAATASVDAAELAARPPTTIACPQCGAPAPLRVAEPTHATCGHCQQRIALGPELVERLRRSGALLEQQNRAERQISANVAKLAERERSWLARLLTRTFVLEFIALGALSFGWLERLERSDWHGFVAFGASAAVVTFVLAGIAALSVPRLLRGIVGRWTALQLPGASGLSCRECGAPLAATAAPVLRCEFCGADNLAGSDVIARLSRGVAATQQRVLAVAERRQQGEEMAAFALVAFPLLTLLAWFAVGALASGALLRLGHDVELPPETEASYAVVRMGAGAPGTACLARIEDSNDGVTLALGGSRVRLEPGRLQRVSVMAPLAPGALVGREVRTSSESGRVASVYRRLNFLRSHVLRLERHGEIYLPWDVGGELVCLDAPGGAGESLPLPLPAP